jgi:hypothetical protein
MKLKPSRVASDVAVGVREALTRVTGVTNLEVSSSGSIINVKARVAPSSKDNVQGVIDDYKDSGFAIVLDRRVA